jgi:hypothetical protein
MAYTVLTNAVVPEVYTDYQMEGSIYKNALARSGIITRNPIIETALNGGASVFNVPFWKMNTVIGTAAAAVNQGGTLTPNNIDAAKQVARRLFWEQSFGTNDLVSVNAGADVMEAIKMGLDGFWDKNLNAMVFSTIQGVIADNVANDSGDMVNDITSATDTAISSDAVIDTAQKLGDFQDKVVAIAMHSKPYSTLIKYNLIDTRPDSEQNMGFGTYLGKTVIVDDTLIDSSNNYWTVLFQQGAFAYGESFNGYVPNEEDRNPLASGGQSYIVTRKVNAIHPLGFAWTSTTEAGTYPSIANLAVQANWNRVVSSVKNVGFVVLKSKA